MPLIYTKYIYISHGSRLLARTLVRPAPDDFTSVSDSFRPPAPLTYFSSHTRTANAVPKTLACTAAAAIHHALRDMKHSWSHAAEKETPRSLLAQRACAAEVSLRAELYSFLWSRDIIYQASPSGDGSCGKPLARSVRSTTASCVHT